MPACLPRLSSAETPFKPWLPKVDLHVHLEGTMSPALVCRLAAKNGVTLKPGLISEDGLSFCWTDDGSAAAGLRAFVQAYDDACAALRTAEDYSLITHDYLCSAAAEGCIYAEIGISADHGAGLGLSYPQMVEAIADGVEKARAETGIEARLISTCVRHYGAQRALRVGAVTAAHPHPLVTGFGMAGDENAGTVADFAPAFQAAKHLARTAHAGEAAGADSVRDAMEHLHCRRFGHMVRAMEDEDLVRDLLGIRAVPEVCVSSNLVLKVFDDIAQHPLRRMFDAGLKVTLGSDDPPFFATTIGNEYALAQKYFHFTDRELLQLSRHAVEEAFIDEATRHRLMAKINAACDLIPPE